MTDNGFRATTSRNFKKWKPLERFDDWRHTEIAERRHQLYESRDRKSARRIPYLLQRKAQSSSLLTQLPIPNYLPYKEYLDLRCGGIAHGTGLTYA